MYGELFDLEGKVAIVTGASRGIGRAISKGLSEMGAKVVLASRKREDLEKVREEIKDAGGEALVVPVHMGNLDDVKNLVSSAVDEFGKIDVLVNNAATNPVFCTTDDIDEAAWDKIMDVNVKGPFFLTREAGKHMAARGEGSVIFVSSEAGVNPMPFLGVYSISKSAVNLTCKVFAQEWGQRGIRVNTIAPGLVKTKFSQALWNNEEILKAVTSATHLRRIAEPDEIVGMAIYLASEASSYVTGQVFLINGGH